MDLQLQEAMKGKEKGGGGVKNGDDFRQVR